MSVTEVMFHVTRTTSDMTVANYHNVMSLFLFITSDFIVYMLIPFYCSDTINDTGITFIDSFIIGRRFFYYCY
jgi:hypothetical protein